MMKRFVVSFKDRQHEAIKKLARISDTSMADIVREAVDEYLKNRNKTTRENKGK